MKIFEFDSAEDIADGAVAREVRRRAQRRASDVVGPWRFVGAAYDLARRRADARHPRPGTYNNNNEVPLNSRKF